MDPFLSSPVAPGVQVRTVLSKGRGLVATDFIDAGKRIIQETVTFWAEDPTPIEICLLSRGLSANDRDRYRNLSHPEQPDKLAIYREQLSGHKHPITGRLTVREGDLDAVTRLVAKFWDNCFELRSAKDGMVGIQGIFIRAARLNHSCTPNAYASYNRTLGRLCVHAIRNIQPSEELLITYIPDAVLFQERSVRMQKLREYFHFECNCPSCDISTVGGASSESKRALIASLMDNIRPHTTTSASPSIESLYVNVLKLMGEIGLYTWEKGQL
jgi:hypothetical protein